jgi:hypothetical protein
MYFLQPNYVLNLSTNYVLNLSTSSASLRFACEKSLPLLKCLVTRARARVLRACVCFVCVCVCVCVCVELFGSVMKQPLSEL